MRIVDDQVYLLFYDLFRKHLKENKFFQREVDDIDTFLETWL